MAALPGAIAHAMARSPAIAEQLRGVDPATVDSRAALARLPVLRKHELLERQQHSRDDAAAPAGPVKAFGGFSAIGWGEALRVFASPGPIYEPESARADYWRFARALYAAGFRAGELAYNCFSYHFTPAGSMMETAAHAVGCTVFPGGTGQTEQQVRAIADLAPSGYTGTPSFLKIILEKADELGVRLDSLRRALVSGEAFPPSLRDWLAARGIEGYQAYGSADLGMIAFETPARQGLVLGEDIIVEIVRPGTGEPVPDGEVGEVVVTTLNPDYPLVRFGTGTCRRCCPACRPAAAPTPASEAGWAAPTRPPRCAACSCIPRRWPMLRRHPEILRARLVISGTTGADRMVLKTESRVRGEDLAKRIADSLRDLTKLRGDVEWVDVGGLPNDGKVIDDVRTYE